jgi:5'-methylthioadenosine nucleosidase
MKKKICIQVAMKEEGLDFAEKMGLIEQAPLDAQFGFRQFTGAYGRNLEIFLILQGTDSVHGVEQIGLEAAAVCASFIIRKHSPDLLINFGTAGGFEAKGFKLGEVRVVGAPILFHDRRVPLPGYAEAAIGSYSAVDSSGLRAALGLDLGKVSSGSSLELSERDREMLESQGAELKEMECAAIAWVAQKTKTPFLALKSITDFVDHPEEVASQFLRNLELASRNVQVKVQACLEYLDQNLEDTVWKT